MNTFAMTALAFRVVTVGTPGGHCYFELGRPLFSHAPARHPTGTQTDEEPHPSTRVGSR